MQPITEDAAARIVLRTVIASYLSIVAIMPMAGIGVDPASAAGLLTVVAFIVVLILYARWRGMAGLPAGLHCVAAVLLLALPVLVWTYAAMKLDMPLADDSLAAMDRALGFDWRGFISFVDSAPALAEGLAGAYTSFPFQILLLPLLLALAGHSTRAYSTLFAFALVCAASSVISIWYPALGTYVAYGTTQSELVNINAKFGFHFLDEFNAVRAGGAFTLFVDRAAGIVTFPSVHAAVAALCAWSAWQVRLLRYPVLLLNAAMAVSAVSHANHYLIDVVAGIGIAGLCVAATVPLFYRQADRRSPILAAARRAAVVVRRIVSLPDPAPG